MKWFPICKENLIKDFNEDSVILMCSIVEVTFGGLKNKKGKKKTKQKTIENVSKEKIKRKKAQKLLQTVC